MQRTESMDTEAELLAPRSEANPGRRGPAAVVDDFFAELGDTFGPPSPSAPSRAGLSRAPADEGLRRKAMAASRRHLEAHQDWLVGDFALPARELRTRVALQYYASIDLEDLGLPIEARRSDDLFTETGISQQLLLDAGRSDFRLPGGVEMSFRKELEARGASLEGNSLEVERMLRDFEQRLVRALLASLGESAPRRLVQAVSRAMSQSGMANLERACRRGLDIVVSGGEQSLRYELEQVSPTVWEVRATMRKYAFEQFVAVGEGVDGDDESGKVQVHECGDQSEILRACTLRFEPSGGEDDAELLVDVCGLVDRVQLVDSRGAPLDFPASHAGASRGQAPVRAWKDALARLWPHLHVMALAMQAAARCQRCRRRACHAVDQGAGALQGLPRMERMVCGTEDADVSMRAPLREPPI